MPELLIRLSVRWLAAAAGAAIGLAAALAGAASVAPEAAEAKVAKKRVKRMVKRELRGRDLQPSFVGACRPRGGKRIWRCRWKAEGVLRTGEPYSCWGRGRYNRTKRPRKRLRVTRCKNRTLEKAALKRRVTEGLRSRGLVASFVGGCRPINKGRRTRCKWIAEGEFSNGQPYYCSGFARHKLSRAKDRLRFDPCKNKLARHAPLLPSPGPHPVLGFNELYAGRGSLSSALDHVGALGAETARLHVLWSGVEPSRGAGRWAGFDQAYQAMLRRGIRPLILVYSAPCWASSSARCEPGQGGHSPGKAYLDDYARFAGRVAARYPAARGIEVWNEPNLDTYWRAGPQPGRYARMLKRTVTEVDARDPSMPVVTGGLAPFVRDGDGRMGYRKFLRKVYERGAAQRADALGAHPYPGRGPNQDYLGAIRRQLGAFLALQDRHGDTGKPIWVTEVGVGTSGGPPYNRAQQATATAEIYSQFRHLASVPVVIFHRLLDFRAGGFLDDFGMIDLNGALKPAFCALAAARGRDC